MDTINPGTRRFIWISAGEASGDLHAALLAKGLRELAPEYELVGMAGQASEAAGMRLELDMRELSIMGLTEVVGSLARVARLLARVRERLTFYRPAAVVLIDCPDFNFIVARMARRLSIPVFYYVSPQVWAWRKGRVKFMRRNLTRLISILPFEREFYQRHGMDVDFVGHPLLDQLPLAELDGIAPEPDLVGMLPGSRRKEIEGLLPEFVEAARLIKQDHPALRFEVALAPGVDRDRIESLLAPELQVRVVEPGQRYQMMRRSRVLLAASGTATLEAALIGAPTVVTYKVSPLSYRIGRMVIRVPFISLPNLVMGEGIFPELIQEEATGAEIAARARAFLDDPVLEGRTRAGLIRLRGLMGEPGAARRAAGIILDRMGYACLAIRPEPGA